MAKRLEKPTSNKKRHMSQKFKTAVIWLYSAVIIVIGVSLFWMLQSRPTDTEEQTRQAAEVDQDVLAVLAEIEENTSVTVPVTEIDDRLRQMDGSAGLGSGD